MNACLISKSVDLDPAATCPLTHYVPTWAVKSQVCYVQDLPNLAKYVAVSSVAGSPALGWLCLLLYLILCTKLHSYVHEVRGARCEQIRMLLPQRSQGSTLKNHMPLTANSTTVASQTDPTSPARMASISQTAMAAQPKLQKALHTPPRNRKLTIPPAWATRLKPLPVCA